MTTIEPSPATKVLDPAKPLTPGDLARLQANRAAARAWLDQCEIDVLEQERRLAMQLEDRERARAAYQAAEDEVQRHRARSAELRVVG